MGLISDIFEDNRERAWDVRWADPLPPLNSTLTRPIPTFPCPACGAVLGADDALSAHLFERHARDLFYVRLDGVVIPDVYYARRGVRELHVVVMGTSTLSLRLRVSDGRTATGDYDPGQLLDVSAILGLAPDFRGSIAMAGTVGTYEREYQIHVREVPHFDPSAADHATRMAQAPLLEDRDPDISAIVRARDDEPLDSLTRRYLDGFGEYLEGVHRERRRDWTSARDRYEHAFGKLRVFPGAMAQSVVAVLEFRMLSGRLLMQRGQRSLFWPAGLFLESTARECLAQEPQTWGATGIWIDDFQEGLLRGIASYCSGDIDPAREAVLSLPPQLSDGPGNRRRAALLAGRAGAAGGDHELARRAYRELEEDPVYGFEALRYLESHD